MTTGRRGKEISGEVVGSVTSQCNTYIYICTTLIPKNKPHTQQLVGHAARFFFLFLPFLNVFFYIVFCIYMYI